jgi:cyclopropane fatty-acyl-phospholipid synthase-like methyltransferase
MQDKTIQAQLDAIYRNKTLSEIPWNMENPPAELIELVEKKIVLPCKAVDLGCGAGNYSIYLTEQGFDVTGIDISPVCIEIARGNAENKGANCRFIAADLCGDVSCIRAGFGFAVEWEVLHHIFPEYRKKYIQNVHSMLDPGAMYLSVCFHEKDPAFGGSGKVRTTTIGTILYFSSEQELTELYEPFFEIIELKTARIPGKTGSHLVNYSLMKKRPVVS